MRILRSNQSPYQRAWLVLLAPPQQPTTHLQPALVVAPLAALAAIRLVHFIHFRVCPVSQPCTLHPVAQSSDHVWAAITMLLHIALTLLVSSEQSELFYWILVACAALTSFSTPQISPSCGVHFWTGLRHCVYEQFLWLQLHAILAVLE